MGIHPPSAGTATLPTGFIVATFKTTADTGFVLLAGGSIGSATSGASVLASDTALNLYTYLWNYLANTEAPVAGGRGASAAADWAANKAMSIPNYAGKTPIGKTGAGSGSTMGGTFGTLDHGHSVPAHYHGMGTGADLNITASGSHVHPGPTGLNFVVSGGSGNGAVGAGAQQSSQTGAQTHTHIAGDFAGRVGLVTGGVDGNSAMTSGTNNHPCFACNYQISL